MATQTMDLTESIVIDGVSNKNLSCQFSENIKIDSSLKIYLSQMLFENLNISESLVTKNLVSKTFNEKINIKDDLKFSWIIEFLENVVIDDQLTLDRQVVMKLVESLIIKGGFSSIMRASEILAEAIVISDKLQLGIGMTLNTEIGIEGESSLSYRAVLSFIEDIICNDTMFLTASFRFEFEESILIEDGFDSTAKFVMALKEGIHVSGLLSLPDGLFEAWVVNVETKAPWQYEDYPFNSFGKHEGKYIGLSSDGLYELSGDTDNGDVINATIRTGLEDFGTARMKSVPMAYFGYTSDGAVLFKTITTESGNKIERWYELKERTANDTTEARVKMGRGVRSVYWQFEITNIDGADFDFDSVKLLPAVLKRRI